MKNVARSKNKGKQYDHEHFIHNSKGKTEHGGLEHHESGENTYKHPHNHSHDNPFPQFGE